MEIIINKGKRIENPTLADVEIALLPMTNQNNFEVLIQKSETDWLRAIWKSTIGIKLEYKNPLTSQIFEDKELFISQKRTIFLFQAYAKNYDGWENQINWIKSGEYSLKAFLLKIMRPIQLILTIITVSILVVLIVPFKGPGTSDMINNYLNAKPMVFGLLIMISGLSGISFSYVNFMYRYEIEGDTNATPGRFIYFSIFAIFGLLTFLAGIWG